MKKSFSFRRSWLDAINLINDSAMRAEITMIVVNYGLTGELLQSSSDVVNAISALIVSRIPRRREAPVPRQSGESQEREAAVAEKPAETAKSIGSVESDGSVGPKAAERGGAVSPQAPPAGRRVVCYRNPHYPDPLPAFAV